MKEGRRAELLRGAGREARRSRAGVHGRVRPRSREGRKEKGEGRKEKGKRGKENGEKEKKRKEEKGKREREKREKENRKGKKESKMGKRKKKREKGSECAPAAMAGCAGQGRHARLGARARGGSGACSRR